MNKTKYKINREKFKTGCITIFKNWVAFRIALENNPHILNYITCNNTIEINDYLEILYDDILTTITKNKFGMKELIKDVAKCLKYFITDYFKIDLEDNSDFETAEILIQLYNSLKDKNEKMYNNLIEKQNKINHKYSIEFPIIENQIASNKKKNKKNEHGKNDGKEDEKREKKKEDEPDEDGFVVVKKGKKGF